MTTAAPRAPRDEVAFECDDAFAACFDDDDGDEDDDGDGDAAVWDEDDGPIARAAIIAVGIATGGDV